MGGSILVVDDEAALRDILSANLRREGYKVMCAGDVPQAEALVRDSRPDLVLLDWTLPGTPGLSFARRLRNDQRTRDISIVLVSARAEEQDKITALESGADDYVTKPFPARAARAHQGGHAASRAACADDVVEIAGLRSTRRRAGERRRPGGRPLDHQAGCAFLCYPPGRDFFRTSAGRVWGLHVMSRNARST
jgi:two-component system phosphate regulon response regulator PhoB